MNRYYDFKQEHQKKIDNFPLLFAFNQKQFGEGCARLGVKDPQKELYSIGAGGYVRKTDSKALNDLLTGLDAAITEAMEDPAFAYDAILYELENHEYCITGDPSPALDVLGLTLDEVKASPMLLDAFNRAAAVAAVERGSYIDQVLQA
jgi:hypothetical protein